MKTQLDQHQKDASLVLTDAASVSNADSRAFSYDVGRVGMVWNLLTGEPTLRYEFPVSSKLGHG